MISCLFTFDLFTIKGTYTIPDANGDPILVRYKAGPKTGYVVDNLDEVLERTNPQGSSGEILFEMAHQEIFFNIFFSLRQHSRLLTNITHLTIPITMKLLTDLLNLFLILWLMIIRIDLINFLMVPMKKMHLVRKFLMPKVRRNSD